MFIAVMNGFIGAATRQPADIRPRAETPVTRPAARRRIRSPKRAARPLPGRYRVLADSFKRAAGFC